MGAEMVALSDGTYAVKTVSAGSAGANAQTSGPNDQSGFGIGAVTAPAAGATIATHTPPPGNNGELHEIEIYTWLSAGAPAAGETNNVQFKFGAGAITDLPMIPTLNQVMRFKFYWTAATGTAISVIAKAAGTAGVTYNAFITATKIVS